jgi:hypothetical protein
MVDMQNVDYKVEGEPGRQCKDCKFYEPEAGNPTKGRCFGHDVEERGTCNYFQSR